MGSNCSNYIHHPFTTLPPKTEEDLPSTTSCASLRCGKPNATSIQTYHLGLVYAIHLWWCLRAFHISTYVYTYTRMHIDIYIYTHTYMCVCVLLCIVNIYIIHIVSRDTYCVACADYIWSMCIHADKAQIKRYDVCSMHICYATSHCHFFHNAATNFPMVSQTRSNLCKKWQLSAQHAGPNDFQHMVSPIWNPGIYDCNVGECLPSCSFISHLLLSSFAHHSQPFWI